MEPGEYALMDAVEDHIKDHRRARAQQPCRQGQRIGDQAEAGAAQQSNSAATTAQA